MIKSSLTGIGDPMEYPLLMQDYLTRDTKPALIFKGDACTYDEIDDNVSLLAMSLAQFTKKHDRVAVFLDDSPETIISIYGILRAGCVFIVLNQSMKTKKLSYILRDCGATILITNSKKAKIVKEATPEAPDLQHIIWTDQIPEEAPKLSYNWSDMLDPVMDTPYHRVIDSDLAALVYTSGSTGTPKGVMCSHANMISAAKSVITYLRNTPDDRVLSVLPLSFGYGLYQALMSVMYGGTLILEPSFAYITKVLDRLVECQATGFTLVPTQIALMLRLKSLNKYDFSSLRYLTSAGAVLPVNHIEMLRELLPKTRIYSNYGLTECKRVSYLNPKHIDRHPTSVGKPMPNCEVKIVDDHGDEIPTGQTGELIIRGPHVMMGYWGSQPLTDLVFKNHSPNQRWLYSGDLFHQDPEGFLYFVGRKDDMIKSGGERIFPKEIEQVMYLLPGVSEAVVTGVQDKYLGLAIKVTIVCHSGCGLTRRDVLVHCNQHLELFMLPKVIEFVDELPRTAHGKIDRNAV